MTRVAERFGRAAGTYDAATPIQRRVAEALAAAVADTAPATGLRVAEFGCGTGHLARAAWPALQPALWIATDIAPPMAFAARRALPPGAFAAVMDAGRPALAPGFDLVASSLALQWIDDPAAAVARWRALVRPGGLLAVATLAEGTFAPWRVALAQAGVTGAGPVFRPEAEIRSWFGPGACVRRLSLEERHASGLAFARAARAAGVDASLAPPLRAGVMRRALAAFEALGAVAAYEALLVVERV